MSGASVIQAASEFGIPISTTHAIMSAVRWGSTIRIFLSWVLTLPATMLLGAAALWSLRHGRAMLR